MSPAYRDNAGLDKGSDIRTPLVPIKILTKNVESNAYVLDSAYKGYEVKGNIKIIYRYLLREIGELII